MRAAVMRRCVRDLRRSIQLSIVAAAERDLQAVLERDPATR
jgi:hypothetical protein